MFSIVYMHENEINHTCAYVYRVERYCFRNNYVNIHQVLKHFSLHVIQDGGMGYQLFSTLCFKKTSSKKYPIEIQRVSYMVSGRKPWASQHGYLAGVILIHTSCASVGKFSGHTSLKIFSHVASSRNRLIPLRALPSSSLRTQLLRLSTSFHCNTHVLVCSAIFIPSIIESRKTKEEVLAVIILAIIKQRVSCYYELTNISSSTTFSTRVILLTRRCMGVDKRIRLSKRQNS